MNWENLWEEVMESFVGRGILDAPQKKCIVCGPSGKPVPTGFLTILQICPVGRGQDPPLQCIIIFWTASH